MRTRRLVPFGIELEGWRLEEAKAADAAAVADLVGRHRVCAVRAQVAGDRELVAFLRRLGDLTFTAGETPVADAPDLNVVTNIGRSTPPRSVFHTDTSYVARPPSYSALRAVTLPSSGGATLFSDQVHAAARLPAAATAWLRGRTVVHGVRSADGQQASARHPLLCRHDATGETALYLTTPERCSGLSGVDEGTSERIVRLLYRRSIRAGGLYRHHWRPGDIVIWDNRATMHRADHSAVAGDRVLHRGLVEGDVPRAS